MHLRIVLCVYQYMDYIYTDWEWSIMHIFKEFQVSSVYLLLLIIDCIFFSIELYSHWKMHYENYFVYFKTERREAEIIEGNISIFWLKWRKIGNLESKGLVTERTLCVISFYRKITFLDLPLLLLVPHWWMFWKYTSEDSTVFSCGERPFASNEYIPGTYKHVFTYAL